MQADAVADVLCRISRLVRRGCCGPLSWQCRQRSEAGDGLRARSPSPAWVPVRRRPAVAAVLRTAEAPRAGAAGKTAVSAPAVPLPGRMPHSVAAGTGHGSLRFVQRESRSCNVYQILAPPRCSNRFEPALNAPSLNIEPSLNDFEQQA
jgi:hypothetical protein